MVFCRAKTSLMQIFFAVAPLLAVLWHLEEPKWPAKVTQSAVGASWHLEEPEVGLQQKNLL